MARLLAARAKHILSRHKLIFVEKPDFVLAELATWGFSMRLATAPPLLPAKLVLVRATRPVEVVVLSELPTASATDSQLDICEPTDPHLLDSTFKRLILLLAGLLIFHDTLQLV